MSSLSDYRAERLLAEGRDLLIDALNGIDPNWAYVYSTEEEAAYAFGLEDLLEPEPDYDDAGNPKELDFNYEPMDSWPEQDYEEDDDAKGYN
jgi:hypothetical protein